MPKPYIVKDHYFKKAKTLGFRARSAFKLEEIQKNFYIIKKGDSVLDLGSAPGSFLQEIAQFAGGKGFIIGIDLKYIHPLEFKNIRTYQADIMNAEEMTKILREAKFDVISADLAPKTSGIKDIDQSKSIELNESVLHICRRHLKDGGKLVTKIFEGADFQKFFHRFKQNFQRAKIYKPKASRDRSRERYLIGIGFKNNY